MGSWQIGDNLFDLPGCPDGVPAEEDGECIEFVGRHRRRTATVTVGGDGISFPQLVTEVDVSGAPLTVFDGHLGAWWRATGTFDAGDRGDGRWRRRSNIDVEIPAVSYGRAPSRA
jgi:hypothetical protein